MITANDIILLIASDTQAVIKVGSIVRCRYCRKYDAYEPKRNNPFDINHKKTCVWLLSIAYGILNFFPSVNENLTKM